ncbi:alanine racemase, partial [Streptococcus pneumoniae]|uniref:alanine racemase n=1 Tax=Streptococcus pneumoniae TaxID=1313 RepID=UPI002B23ED28
EADPADNSTAPAEPLTPNVASRKEVPELGHASNSATTLWHGETIFNAVRMGDAMYGLIPSGAVLDWAYDLMPAVTVVCAL